MLQYLMSSSNNINNEHLYSALLKGSTEVNWITNKHALVFTNITDTLTSTKYPHIHEIQTLLSSISGN